jgi:hypothetical protein
MKLLISASTIEKAEKMLNECFYSTTYKIVDNKIMFKNPLIENKNLTLKMKSKKYQIYTN